MPEFQLAHAVDSDVIPTLVFFNNCRLKNVKNQFENKHFEVVARGLNQWKKHKRFQKIIVLLHPHSQRVFANVSLTFSNSNNRRVTFAHVAIFCLYATD